MTTSETKDRLKGLRVAILATDGYEEAELLEPREALNAAGARTVVISPKSGTIRGMKHDEKAGSVKVDLPIENADPAEFDAVLLPGGALNADALRVNANAQNFVKAMDAHGKPIAVICHGPWLLISAGLTRGHTLTSYFTISDDIKNSGGNWLDKEVVRDRNWVSSRKPDDIPAFDREMLSLFGESMSRGKAAGA
jgi:protease I